MPRLLLTLLATLPLSPSAFAYTQTLFHCTRTDGTPDDRLTVDVKEARAEREEQGRPEPYGLQVRMRTSPPRYIFQARRDPNRYLEFQYNPFPEPGAVAKAYEFGREREALTYACPRE